MTSDFPPISQGLGHLTPERWQRIGKTVARVENDDLLNRPNLQPTPTPLQNHFLPYNITGADSVSGSSITFPVRYTLKQVKVLINPSTPAMTFEEIPTAETIYGYNVFEFVNNGTFAGGINGGGSANNYVVNPVGFYFSGSDCSSKGWTRLTDTGHSATLGHIVFARSAKGFLAESTDRYVVFSQPNTVDVCACS